MKILWISKNNPMQEQLDALKVLFPAAQIEVDTRDVRNTEELVARIRSGKYDEIVAVIPWSMLKQLLSRGIYPLYAKIERDKNGSMRHVGIERVESIDMKTRPLLKKVS
jgi:hypothetical protein